MPYITKNRREYVESIIKQFEGVVDGMRNKYNFNRPEYKCGDLNYLITSLLNVYLKKKGEKYQTYNDIIGVLECAKIEYYRKHISPYENKKIKENGDV